MTDVRIILGPPGTGKTTHLLEIMEEEMGNEVQPEEIAFVSFTKKAAQEAMTRAVERFRLLPEDFPYIRTLHSLAYKELRINKTEVMQKENYAELGEILGVEFSNKISIYDQDYASMESVKFSGDRYNYLYGFAKARQLTPKECWELHGDYDISWLEYERYHKTVDQYKEEHGLLDFSDMLCQPIEPIDVKVVIIDEAQDLSTTQWQFALNLFSKAERIYIAGDDDQAIYTWSGADVRYFLNMPGKKIILNQSYRIPKAVHRLAQSITKNITNRLKKEYKPAPHEGSVEYYTDIDQVDFSQGTWLLLARNGYMLNKLVLTIRDHGFLYSYRGESVVNASHLRAIQLWELRRKGVVLDIWDQDFLKEYLPKELENKPDEWPDVIWHEALTKIGEWDREYYISMLRRGEKLTVEPRINISTIHGVKGGEADNVLLLTDVALSTLEGMNNQPDNEWRVWYVGVTRAKHNLHILLPQTRNFVAL